MWLILWGRYINHSDVITITTQANGDGTFVATAHLLHGRILAHTYYSDADAKQFEQRFMSTVPNSLFFYSTRTIVNAENALGIDVVQPEDKFCCGQKTSIVRIPYTPHFARYCEHHDQWGEPGRDVYAVIARMVNGTGVKQDFVTYDQLEDFVSSMKEILKPVVVG